MVLISHVVLATQYGHPIMPVSIKHKLQSRMLTTHTTTLVHAQTYEIVLANMSRTYMIIIILIHTRYY